MAKLTAEEFIKKYTVDKKISEDDDVLIELMEDISDSVVENETEGSDEVNNALEEENKIDEAIKLYEKNGFS